MKRRRGLRWEWEPAGRSAGRDWPAGSGTGSAFRRFPATEAHQRRDSRKPITRPAAAAMPAVCHGEVWA